MHYDERIGYLLRQVQRAVMPQPPPPAPPPTPPPPLTRAPQVDACRQLYQPYFMQRVMPRKEGQWPGFYCASMVTCQG